MAISVFRGLEVFLGKESKGGCRPRLQPCQGWQSPFTCLNSESLAQHYRDVDFQYEKFRPKGSKLCDDSGWHF